MLAYNILLILIAYDMLPDVSVVTQEASFTIFAIKMRNASALYAET